MNFDLIEKLIRLANNNPNENEANLAARKVCKFLHDHKFHDQPIRGYSAVQPPPPQYKSASNPRPSNYPFEDFFKERKNQWDGFGKPPKQEKTASEKAREDETKRRASWTSVDYDESGSFNSDLYDIINQILKDRKSSGKSVDNDNDNEYWFNELNRQKQERDKARSYGSTKSSENPYRQWVDPNWKPPSKQKEERLLKCKKCGNSKLTKFVGLPELYECNTCQWTAYEETSKNATKR